MFLALDAREERRRGVREIQVHKASLVELAWLEALVPGLLRRERAICFDAERERVVGLSRLFYLDLLVREDARQAVDPVAASACLAQALAPQAADLFKNDPEAALWLARYAFACQALPEMNWPDFGESALAEFLPMLCQRRTRVQEVREAAKIPYLEGRLSSALRRELSQSAPVLLRLPSGREFRLTYEPGRPPMLAVRLQELFGWTETPRLARGRVPVLLQLLGPNHRPVQITADLRSFWTTTYHQVRKDLRARYPKHSWPEDPFTAQPIAGPRRKSR
jgi:ATP-dependent helicase HrpB